MRYPNWRKLEELTVSNLQDLAKEAGVAYSGLRKAELIDALEKAEKKAGLQSQLVDYFVLRSFVGHYEWQGRPVSISAGMNSVIQVPRNKGWEAAGFVELIKPSGREAAAMKDPEKR